jgi:hypothetical protein
MLLHDGEDAVLHSLVSWAAGAGRCILDGCRVINL